MRILNAAAVCFLLLISPIASADDGVQVMLHRGHPIKDFVISYDERYILTRSDGEVCVWDLNNRMLMATLPMFTSEIYAHPTDPALFYADTQEFKLKAIEDPSLDANEVINWTTGKRIGRVSSGRMPKFRAGSDFTFVKNGDMLLMTITQGDNVTLAGTIGGMNRTAGKAVSYGTDSLLTKGQYPLVWDLRHAALVGKAPSAENKYPAYFQPDIFQVPAKGRIITAVSRPYGNGRFLVGTDNTFVERIEDKGEALIEGSLKSEKPLRFGSQNCLKIRDIKIAPHDDYAVVASAYRTVATLDLKTISYTGDLAADYEDLELVTSCEILPDETIVAGTTLGRLNFWKKGQTKSYRQSRVHHAEINSIALSADSTRMFTSDKAGQITVWDVGTLEPLVYAYQVADGEKSDYIFLTPDHYYKATPGINRYINFVKDGQPYAFEQFDLRNNRPDIVLSRLGGDPAEIELLKKAWKKRLRRAGISEESLSSGYHVPTTEVNRVNIPFISVDGSITLDAVFTDSQYDLSEVTVTINGVPVLTPDKRYVTGRLHRLHETLALTAGNNEIAVWCTNVKGSSSLRQTFNVTYAPENAVKPDLYVVAAGVSTYADNCYNLGYAAKDAGDFVKALKESSSDCFGKIKTLTLTDEQVTVASLNKIRPFLSESRPDDVVLVFFAGHGVLDSEFDYYLGAHDMNFANPKEGGIPYDDFMGVFEGVPALNRACFIDACHSGELDKEDYVAVNTVAMPKGEELLFRSAGQNVSAKEDVDRVNTILSDMFRDTRWGVGATVLSSAGGGELAVESQEWNNGLFTYCLLKGLQEKSVDVDNNGRTSLTEWINYTRRQVSVISKGLQSPTLRSQNYHNDLEIK